MGSRARTLVTRASGLPPVTPTQNPELTRARRDQSIVKRREKLPKIRESCRSSTQNNGCDLDARRVLLIWQVAVDRHEHIELCCGKTEKSKNAMTCSRVTDGKPSRKSSMESPASRYSISV